MKRKELAQPERRVKTATEIPKAQLEVPRPMLSMAGWKTAYTSYIKN